jgi:hypothetical protein
MVKIFTMVKGEDDIVEDWVMYHGNLFGFENLFVIDNMSLDNTYAILQRLQNTYGINLYRENDYKKKGDCMTALFTQHCRNEYGIPLDIDEMLVHYNPTNKQISCDKTLILETLRSLPKAQVYKMEYIISKITTTDGYTRAAKECEWGKYTPYGSMAKSFFHSSLFHGIIDHGNHYATDNYYLTPFCLVHFHNRNLEQIKKKTFNNVKGLGHDPFNLANMRRESYRNQMGFHHIQKQVIILDGTYRMPVEEINEKEDISLKPLNSFFN